MTSVFINVYLDRAPAIYIRNEIIKVLLRGCFKCRELNQGIREFESFVFINQLSCVSSGQYVSQDFKRVMIHQLINLFIYA